MADISSLNIKLTADIAGLSAKLDEASKRIGAFGKQTQASSKSMLSAGALGGAVAALTTKAIEMAGAVVNYSKQVAAAIEQTNKFANAVGASVTGMLQLQYGADIAGVSMDKVQTSMARLSKALGGALTGGSQRSIFERLGLSPESLKKQGLDQAFQTVLTQIAKLNDKSEQTKIAMELFGRGSAPLLQLAGGFERAAAEANAFGIAVSKADAANIDEMNDSFTRLSGMIKGAVSQMISGAAPTILGMTTSIKDATLANMEWAQSWRMVGEAIAGTTKALSFGRSATTQIISASWEASAKLVAWATGSESVKQFADAMGDLNRETGKEFQNKFFGKGAAATASLATGQPKVADISDMLGEAENEEITNRVKSIFEATRTPLERLQTELADLNQLFETGELDAETYARAVEAANKEYTDVAFKDQIKAQEDAQRRAESISEGVRTPFERAMADINEAKALMQQGLLSKEDFGRAQEAALKSIPESPDVTAARSIAESVMTPFEKASAELDKAARLVSVGALDPETFAKYQASVMQEFMPEIAQDMQDAVADSPQATLGISSRDPIGEIAKAQFGAQFNIQQQQLTIQQKMAQYLQGIFNATQGGARIPVFG